MNKKIKMIGIYSGIIGASYIIYGLIEMAAWILGPLDFPLYPSPDIFAGFILIITGSVFIYRIRDLLHMKYEGLSFLFVGLVLSAIVGIMYVLIMGADAMDAIILGEAWEFDPYSYNIPAMVLFLLSLPGWIIMKHRGEFTE